VSPVAKKAVRSLSEITFDSQSFQWALHTTATTYAFRWDGAALRHLHWGQRLTVDQVRAIAGPAAARWLDGDGGDEEIAVEGGARFGPAGLRARFADGTRGLELDYVGTEISGLELQIGFRDRQFPLQVDLHYRLFDDSDVIQRFLTLRHIGEGDPITLLRADSACWVLPERPDWRLSHAIGGWGAENRLQRIRVPYAETVLTSRRGVSSHQASPWLMLDDGTATEEAGQVWSAALAWSGSWRITVARTPENRVSATGGFGHDDILQTLQPHETLSTPAFLGLYTRAGFGAASRGWHGHIRAHVLPQPTEIRPVLFNSWEATGFAINERQQMALAARAASLGAELFVVDDGWFSERNNEAAGLGDWWVSRDGFPHGLRPLIEEVRRLGMGFGLWVEPEMVNPDSRLYRTHPDWVLHHPHRRRSLQRNQLVLNFARPDVAAWAHDWLDALVSEHRLEFLKWDMNRPFTEAGWPGYPDPDRLWIDHVRGVYAIMDQLRNDHPGLRIEGCSSGGGRADLGMLARTDQIWVSDNTDAFDRLAIQHGHGQILPAAVMGAWVTDCPNPLTNRTAPLRFRFHAAMTGVMGLSGKLLEWSDEELDEARLLVRQYKRIRHVVQHGDLYRLREPGAVQYISSEGREVVVLAWAADRRYGLRHGEPPLRFAGLDGLSRYRDTDSGAIHQGSTLMACGLQLDLPPGDYSSILVHLVRES
jgi:alpha-galactosidase